jgi:hypothetical protein
MEGNERRGRSLVLYAIVSLVLLSGALVALQLVALGPKEVLRGAVRFVLTVALGVAVFRGHRWARGVLIVLCLAGCALAAWLLWAQAMPKIALYLIGAQGAFYGAVGLLLWFSPSVKAFVDYQSFAMNRRPPRG